MRLLYRSELDVFINNIIRSGKKGRGRKAVYEILKLLAREAKECRPSITEFQARKASRLARIQRARLGDFTLDPEEEEFLAMMRKAKEEEEERLKIPVIKLDMIVMLVVPGIRYKLHRKGAKVYKIPYDIEESKERSFVYRAMLEACNGKVRGSLERKLFQELGKMREGGGQALKKRRKIVKELEKDYPYLNRIKWKR